MLLILNKPLLWLPFADIAARSNWVSSLWSAGAVMLVQPRTLGNYHRLYIENHETLMRSIRMVGGTGVLPIMHEWMIDKALR